MDENFDANEVMNVVHDENDDNDDGDVHENEVTNDYCESENDENENMSDPRKASAEILKSEQKSDTVGLWLNVKELVITYKTRLVSVIH